MAIPLPQPVYFQPFNALATGKLMGQQITKNALANQYQQVQNQYEAPQLQAAINYTNSGTGLNQANIAKTNVETQWLPQMNQAQIAQALAGANLSNTQANYYPQYVNAMAGRYSSVVTDGAGNPWIVNRVTGQATPANAMGQAPRNALSTQVSQGQPGPVQNALYPQQTQQMPMANNGVQAQGIPAGLSGMGFVPKAGGVTVLPNGQAVRTPTVSNLSNTQNRLTAVNESEPLVNQFVQGYQPYNSLYGSKIGVIKDSILANLGDQGAQQRLQNLVASELIKQPAAGALVRSATGAAPTQVELEAQEGTLAPYEIPNSLIPASIRNAGTLQGTQALRQAADVASQPMYQGYAQPTVNTGQQAQTSAQAPTYSVNSPEVQAAAKQLKVSPQQVIAYLQSRGMGG